MLCLAAQRTPYRKIVVISPDDGCEFEIDEDILNIHMIELGQFCRIEIENNVPVSFVSEEDGVEGLKVEVNKDLALISGVRGKLVKGFALFYQTEQFGKVACRDEEPGVIGSVHNIVVSRLPEEKRNGMYSKCVWGAISDNKSLEKSTKEQGELTKHVKDLKIETISDSEEDEEQSEGKSDSRQVLCKRVTGFISGLNPSKSHAFMTCNLTFPGIDGIIRYSKNNPLKIGDWVEVRFTSEDCNKYFPPNPTEKTPRFFTNKFKKTPKPSQYSVRLLDKVPEVTIKNVKLTADHEEGDNIHDRFLGLISDKQKLLTNGKSTFDIIVSRHRKFAAKGEKLTTWVVTKATPVADCSAESSEAESIPSKENKKVENKKRVIKEENIKTQKPGNSRVNNAATGSPMFPMSPGPPMNYPMMNFPRMGPPMNQMMPPGFYFPTMPPPRMPNDPSSSRVKNEIRGTGFSEEAADDDDLVSKRAVVTSVKPNRVTKHGKDSIAYLWLLDDHKQSVFYISDWQKLRPGHFFDGLFARNGSKWECKKYTNSLGKLIDGCISNDTIELQIVVYEYFPVETGRLIPETYHKFLGRIADRYDKLPVDCSGGVKICTKLCRLEEKNQYSWVVTRVFQSKHIQLLAEFYKAWQAPGIRDMVRLKYSKEFRTLKNILDVQQKGRLKGLANEEVAKRNKRSSGQQVREDRDSGEKKQYGWVTVHDGDFVRMIVFPREENQEMSTLKKNVTDKLVYKNVREMAEQRLYEVKLGEGGRVIEMIDCPQYFSANEKGEIVFKFISTGDDCIAQNVSLAEPVGMPKWLGKLMFELPERSIPKKSILWEGRFRLLADKNAFIDHDAVMKNGVCFSNVGQVEKLTSKELSAIRTPDRASKNEIGEDDDIDAFKAKLECLSKDEVYSLYKDVRQVLRNETIVEELKKQKVYTESLHSFLTT